VYGVLKLFPEQKSEAPSEEQLSLFKI